LLQAALLTIIIAAILALLIRNTLMPLNRLRRIVHQVARENFSLEIFHGTITKEVVKKADEISQIILGFEIMRRKVNELEGKMKNLVRETASRLDQANEKLIEQEKTLQRANARLVGQSQELQKMNDELHAKNQELLQTNSKLLKLDKIKTDFILIAAHELRTPIQPIIGSVQLAEKGLISSNQAWKTITVEAKRLASLATYVLDISKIESGNFTYNMKPLSVRKLVDRITFSSSKFATPEGGVVSIDLDLDVDANIFGDNDRLIQAFENIINNAIKFAGKGTITIQTRNNYDGEVVEIRIIDDGPGIPEEILPILFNKFVTKTPENLRGTGLGLFITKAIIEAHDGTIIAKNNGNKGAIFSVSLPIKDKPVSSFVVET